MEGGEKGMTIKRVKNTEKTGKEGGKQRERRRKKKVRNYFPREVKLADCVKISRPYRGIL